MKKFLIICMIILPFLLVNNINAGKVTITSNPDGSVIYVKNAKKGERIKVGKTPYVGNMEQLIANISSSSAFVVEVAKPGFDPYRILLTKANDMDIDLDVNLEVSRNIKMAQDMDLLTSDLFDVQRMIRGKDFQSSLEKLNLLEKKFPHFSIIAEMKGSVFYFMKEFKRSLGFYRKAFSLNPENREAYQMKIYLEKKFNIFKERKG